MSIIRVSQIHQNVYYAPKGAIRHRSVGNILGDQKKPNEKTPVDTYAKSGYYFTLQKPKGPKEYGPFDTEIEAIMECNKREEKQARKVQKGKA